MTTNAIVSTLALDIVDNDVLEITPRSAVEAKVLSKEQAKQAKLLEKEKVKQAKLQEKEQAKQAKLQEKEQAKQAKKRSRSKKDQCEEPPEKRKRGRPQKEPKMITYLGENNHDYVDSLGMTVMEAEYITEEDEDEEMDSESDDEDETLVTEFTFQNKLYYKCEENTLYDPESHIELGYYNPIDNTIVLSDV